MFDGDLSARYSRDSLVNLLCDHGTQFKGNSCRCPLPGHEDKHPSAWIWQKEGVWRFRCPVCDWSGDYYDVKAKLEGKELKDVMPKGTGGKAAVQAKRPPGRSYPTLDHLVQKITNEDGRVEAVYPYTEIFVVIRYMPKGEDKKKYKQVHSESGVWFETTIPKPWPLWNRESVGTTEEPVIVVEGEKCVEALRDIGVVAVTSCGGAENGKYSDWTPLAGCDCILWPDNDDKGFRHMTQVSEILLALNPPARVRRIDVKQLSDVEKWDVADCLKDIEADDVDAKHATITRICSQATTVSPVGELIGILKDTISGKREAIPISWKRLNKLAWPFMPGCITLLCGAPGCGKSFLLLEAGYFMHKRGVEVALYMLEEKTSYHLHRLLTQLSETPMLLNPEWVKENPEKTLKIAEMYQGELDSFMGVISDAPNEAPRIDNLLDWSRDKAKSGARVIVIDPISVADMGREPWNAATQFMNAAKRIAVDFNSSIVVAVHPRKGTNVSGIVDLDSVAGGAAFTRLSQTVFWIERHLDDHMTHIANAGGFPIQRCCNRTIHILKARNGSGQGSRMAFNFNPETFRFKEIGMIASEHKRTTFHKHTPTEYRDTTGEREEDDCPF